MKISRGRLRRALGALIVAVGALTVSVPIARAAPGEPAYHLAGGCFRLSTADGEPVGGHGPYFAKAAALGEFLFSGTDGSVLTVDGASITDRSAPTDDAIFAVSRLGPRYRLASTTRRGVSRDVNAIPVSGCRPYPEAQLNVEGGPRAGTNPDGTLFGLVDSHAHLMASQFLGGALHCGKPYSPLGITVALNDCPDHGSDGWPAVSEHVLSQPGPHSADGWPTFRGWPKWYSLTHEQTYYRWLERAWRSGLRVVHNYFVQNRVLCELYPLKKQPCDEMESVRIQRRMLGDLVDYVDAQAGGPGKGFLRLATSAGQVRSIVAAGKVAITMGIEISEPFGCREINGKPRCTEADINRGMDELKAIGVRQMILTHKFDNALGGTHIDSDFTGAAVETGQLIATGHPWQTEPCRTPRRDHDAPGAPAGQCNVRGLTALGEHAVNAAIDRQMIVDVDHVSVKSADKILAIAARRHYPGVTSSHSWTDEANYRAVQRLGGAVGLYASGAEKTPGDKHSESFIDQWRAVRAAAPPGEFFGLGFGPDMNGLGKQAPPRPSARRNPVRYPFLAADGTTRVFRQVTGAKTYDVNVDGTAHYGLIPDWVESLRVQAGPDGDALVADLYRGAEAYIRMWDGVESHR